MITLLRLLTAPVRVLVGVADVAARSGYRAGRGSARVARSVTRLAGWRAVTALVVGIALGMLFAPAPGRALRLRLRSRRSPGVADDELEARVAFELAHAPRTWHLPQPEVRAEAGVIRLVGVAPSAQAVDALARAAGAVPGVRQVENHLAVGAGPA